MARRAGQISRKGCRDGSPHGGERASDQPSPRDGARVSWCPAARTCNVGEGRREEGGSKRRPGGIRGGIPGKSAAQIDLFAGVEEHRCHALIAAGVRRVYVRAETAYTS